MYPESKVIIFGKHHENLNLFSFADEQYRIHDVPDDLVIDHGFECVGSSASQTAIEQMIDLINPQGTINLFGVSEYPIPINTRMNVYNIFIVRAPLCIYAYYTTA